MTRLLSGCACEPNNIWNRVKFYRPTIEEGGSNSPCTVRTAEKEDAGDDVEWVRFKDTTKGYHPMLVCGQKLQHMLELRKVVGLVWPLFELFGALFIW